MGKKLKYINSIFNVNIWFILLGIDLTGVFVFVQKYIFADIGFLKWLVIAMIIDLATGITKAWVLTGWQSISSKGLRDTISKCVQYGSFLIITHVLTHFEVDGKVGMQGMQWMNKLAYEFLILIEIKSVYENLIRINPDLDFVKFLVEKITKYYKNKEK